MTYDRDTNVNEQNVRSCRLKDYDKFYISIYESVCQFNRSNGVYNLSSIYSTIHRNLYMLAWWRVLANFFHFTFLLNIGNILFVHSAAPLIPWILRWHFLRGSATKIVCFLMDWMGAINLMCTYVRRKELLEAGMGDRFYWVISFSVVIWFCWKHFLPKQKE